ncbi:unnamed protein product [Moneuplotes crassus]|uniref:Uncharacterized protein n=1 Tax=Euplotes crassus TaxID=5936 RepID=A0AAD1X5K9_EUPCR|nr:unnamed protein product [Moneuplotes crassus]
MGASNTKIQSSFCCAVERRDCKDKSDTSSKRKVKGLQDHQIVDTNSKTKLAEQEKVQNKQSSKEYKKRLMRTKPKSQKICKEKENKNKALKKPQKKTSNKESITGWDKLMSSIELTKFSKKFSPAEIRRAGLSNTSASRSNLHKSTSSVSKPSPFSKVANFDFFKVTSEYSSPSKRSKPQNTPLKIDSCYLTKTKSQTYPPKKRSQFKTST